MIVKQKLADQLNADIKDAKESERLFPEDANFFIGRNRYAWKILAMLEAGYFDDEEGEASMEYESKIFHKGSIDDNFYTACTNLYMSIRSKTVEELTDEEASFIFYFTQIPEVQRRLHAERDENIKESIRRFEQNARTIANSVTELGVKCAEIWAKHTERINSIRKKGDE